MLQLSYKHKLSEEDHKQPSNIFPSESIIQSVKSTLFQAAKPELASW